LDSAWLSLTQNGLGKKAQPDGAAAYTELRAVLQERSADTLVFKKSSVSGVKILQVDRVLANFEDTMVARDFRILERKVGALATNDGTGSAELEGFAFGGPAGNGQYDIGIRREAQGVVNRGQAKPGGGSVGAGERRHRGDDHGFVGTALDFHDCGLATTGTAELYLGVFGHDVVLQKVLLPTMHATGLHTFNLPRRARGEWSGRDALAARVTDCGVRLGGGTGVLRYKIQDKAGERTCLNTYREKS